MLTLMTSEVILYVMKNLRLHNISIHRIFFIKIGSKSYMLERNKLKSRNHGVPDSRSFLEEITFLKILIHCSINYGTYNL